MILASSTRSPWIHGQAGFTVNHQTPTQTKADGFSFKDVPLYGGTNTMPNAQTMIVMEYAQPTWCSPPPSTKIK